MKASHRLRRRRTLKSTAASRGHVVAVFTSGTGDTADSVPAHIAVATKPATQTDGSFVRRMCASSNRSRTHADGRRAASPHGAQAEAGPLLREGLHSRRRGRLHAEVPVQGDVVERATRRHPAAALRTLAGGSSSPPPAILLASASSSAARPCTRACRGSPRRSVRSPCTAAGRGRRSSSAP